MTGHEAPEAADDRQFRRMMWQTLRAQYADTLADGKLGGLTDDAARRTAARAIRGELRALMSELLTCAPIPAIVAFLAVGREWGEAGERLLEQSDAVLWLIEHTVPRPTWTAIEGIDRHSADDDARWSLWAQAWAEAFTATGPAAQTAFAGTSMALTSVHTEEEVSSLRSCAPWLVSAATILGATTVVVAATRE